MQNQFYVRGPSLVSFTNEHPLEKGIRLLLDAQTMYGGSVPCPDEIVYLDTPKGETGYIRVTLSKLGGLGTFVPLELLYLPECKWSSP